MYVIISSINSRTERTCSLAPYLKAQFRQRIAQVLNPLAPYCGEIHLSADNLFAFRNLPEENLDT